MKISFIQKRTIAVNISGAVHISAATFPHRGNLFVAIVMLKIIRRAVGTPPLRIATTWQNTNGKIFFYKQVVPTAHECGYLSLLKEYLR